METDPLGRWLAEAEADLGSGPAIPADLLTRVNMARARRRRQQRVVRTGCAALLLMVGAGWGTWHWHRSRPAPAVAARVTSAVDTVVDLARLRLEIELLDLEAKARTDGARRLADALRRQDRIAALQAEAAPDPRIQIRQELDGAAFTLLNQGDRLYRELALREPAAAAYREVIRLFPESCWAQVAEQRLAQLEQKAGETS